MIHVLFTTPNDPSIYSKAIHLWQGRKFSHVALVFEVCGVLVVFHASKLTVHFLSYDKFMSENVVLHKKSFTANRHQLKDLFKWSVKLLGLKYSIKNILGLVIHDVFKVTWLLDGNKAFICSELVAKGLKIIGIELFKSDEILDYVTPEDVLEAIERNENAL